MNEELEKKLERKIEKKIFALRKHYEDDKLAIRQALVEYLDGEFDKKELQEKIRGLSEVRNKEREKLENDINEYNLSVHWSIEVYKLFRYVLMYGNAVMGISLLEDFVIVK